MKRPTTRKNLFLLLITTLLYAGCSQSEHRNLITSSVTLQLQPLVITPTKPLKTPGHLNELWIELPTGYTIDTKLLPWDARSPDGTKISIQAILTTKDGIEHKFIGYGSVGWTNKLYLSLHSEDDLNPKAEYKRVLIWSSEPLKTDEISWESYDESL